MKIAHVFLMLCFALLAKTNTAQIITSVPAFPTENDTIEIIYDASLGNGDLDGVYPIYAHTGVITSNSSSDTDWEHVVGTWGTADPIVQMTPLGANKHKITIPVQSFYSINDGETVFKLAFVFRNTTGSLVGREADGGDIYFQLYEEGVAASIISPNNGSLVAANETIEILAHSNDSANLSLFADNIELVSDSNSLSISYSLNAADYISGQHIISFKADFTDEVLLDSVYFTILGDYQTLPVPDGIQEGINISESNPGEVTFNLFAPGKGLMYLLGDFNDWLFDDAYILNQDSSGDFHWLTVYGLDPNEEYAFQYYIVDESLRIGDPYCEKVLDPWNDPYIDESVYPDLKEYPIGLTTGIVSTFQINEEEYTWTDQSYIRPDKKNLIVYELLIRDFLDAHSYQMLSDTLNYLDSLGITAIELMPVNEFEGNESWGYNPDFFLAPDKYYGPKNAYKDFVNECHERGIAVIMDIAMNHSFGLNPQVKMYFNPDAGQWGQPTADSPWFNEIPKHDYNVGYDYNHESQYTKKFVDSVLIHWVTEYHIDGYRMDLSKGFTQVNTLGNVYQWGLYDQSRINILSSYANHVWNYDPSIYMILEHFAENNEEETLSDLGFMIWGNINHEYLEASMGYPSDLSWVSYAARGWDDPNLISYMESHDEERMMYKNVTYGAINGDYDVTNQGTALDRCELAAVFFIPVPGPKMIWQFGELGYDYSINYCENGSIDESCRTHPKPIKWDYYDQWQRHQLFIVYKELIKLKREYPVFTTEDFNLNVNAFQKSIQLNSTDMNVAIVGNFDTEAADMSFSFVHGGYWYEYFSGDSLLAGDLVPDVIPLSAGEYRLYTDVKLGEGVALAIDENADFKEDFMVFPNPSNGEFNFIIPGNLTDEKHGFVYSSSGKLIDRFEIPKGQEIWKWFSPNSAPKGMYFVKIVSSKSEYSARIVIE